MFSEGAKDGSTIAPEIFKNPKIFVQTFLYKLFCTKVLVKMIVTCVHI